jgi:RNA polymerase sigma-B factor
MTATFANDSKQQSLQLLRCYHQSGCRQTRDKLFKMNIGLVRKEAHYWANQAGESFEDLVQVGSIGLLAAIDKFELEKGYAFSTFAIPYIRGEIQHYLRDRSTTIRMPRRWLALVQQAGTIRKKWQALHGTIPSEGEVAEELGISRSEWEEIKLAYRNRSPVSLDAPLGNEEESDRLADILPDGDYQSFQLAQEDYIRLQQGLANLERHTRAIVEGVFLQDLTQKQVAENLNISAITVSRHIKKGVESLKAMLN